MQHFIDAQPPLLFQEGITVPLIMHHPETATLPSQAGIGGLESEAKSHAAVYISLNFFAEGTWRAELGMLFVEEISADDREFNCWRWVPAKATVEFRVSWDNGRGKLAHKAKRGIDFDVVCEICRAANEELMFGIIGFDRAVEYINMSGVSLQVLLEIRVSDIEAKKLESIVFS